MDQKPVPPERPAARPGPVRVGHHGPLLRPAALLAARVRAAHPDVDPDEARAVEDAAVARAVAMQRDLGAAVATDGGFRRTAWLGDFAPALAGVAPGAALALLETPAFPAKHPVLAEAAALVRLAASAGWVVIPGPQALAGADLREAPEALRDREGRAAAFGAAWAQALAALAAAGLGRVQIDAAAPSAADFAEWTDALAAALAGRPAGLAVTLGLRARDGGPFRIGPGCEPLLEAVFALDVDAVQLTAPDLAPPTMAPLGLAPGGGARVMLGLAASGATLRARRESLLRGVEAAGRAMDPAGLGLTPDAPFPWGPAVEDRAAGLTVEAAEVRAEDAQRRALEAVVEAAVAFWGAPDA